MGMTFEIPRPAVAGLGMTDMMSFSVVYNTD